MYVLAQINDPSQQIKFNQVYVKCTALNLNQRLDYKGGYYDYTVLFGQKNISAGLGEYFTITGINNSNKEFIIGKTKLTRVIDKEITVRSPINGEIVSSQPTLRWDRFLPGFDFHYSIQIYDETNLTTPAWHNEDVSSDEISIVPEYELSSPRKYFWYMICEDQYGNKSISKRYSFEVQ